MGNRERELKDRASTIPIRGGGGGGGGGEGKREGQDPRRSPRKLSKNNGKLA